MHISEHDFIPYQAAQSLASGHALILAPHPDDEVFGCAGAIMRHVAAKDPIRVIVVTDGALGGASDSDHVLARQRESRAAACVLGYGEPIFWGLPDRGLEYGEALIERILNAIEAHEATLVYAPSWWEVHPDHLVLALAAAEAVRRCTHSIQLAMYEVGVPVFPNRLLDITDLQAGKQAAMACFVSQLEQQRYDAHITGLNRFRTYTLPSGVLAAEAYRVLSGEALRAPPLSRMRPSGERPLTRLAASLRGATAWDEQERQGLTHRMLSLQQEIETLRGSTSWRVTAPLRWLMMRLRRARASSGRG